MLGVAVLVTCATGCSRPPASQATGPVHVLESDPRLSDPAELVAPDPACARSPALAELARYDDGLAMLDRSVELVDERDRACGPPDDFDRQCRSVFLLGSTQPAVEWANGGDWRASLRVWHFGVADGSASSSPDFALMWAQLSEYTSGLTSILETADETELARRLVAVGEAADDLSALEDICLASAS